MVQADQLQLLLLHPGCRAYSGLSAECADKALIVRHTEI